MRLKKLSLLLALTLLVSVSALPVTAHAGGSKDTTPPTLTASMEGDALKIESSDDLSGVEAVFVDENRINSLTDGKASVALKDYAGTEKQVSIYAKDYAGNRSDVVKLDNPYYKEPAPEKKPATTAPQSPSGTQTKPPKEEKPSGSNAATPSGGGNSSGSDNSTGQHPRVRPVHRQNRLRKKNLPAQTLQPLPAAEILPVQITVPDSRKILLRSRKVHLPRKAPERYRTTSAVRMGKNSFTPSLRTRAMSFIW